MKSSFLWPAFLLWFAAAAGSHIILFFARMPFVYNVADSTQLNLVFAATRIVNLGEAACSVLFAIALFAAARDAEKRTAVRVMSAVVLLMFGAMSLLELPISLLGGAGLSGPGWAVYLACRALLGLSALAAAIAVYAAPRNAWAFAILPPVIHLAAFAAYQAALSQSYGSTGLVEHLIGFVIVGSILLLLCAIAASLKRCAAPAP